MGDTNNMEEDCDSTGVLLEGLRLAGACTPCKEEPNDLESDQDDEVSRRVDVVECELLEIVSEELDVEKHQPPLETPRVKQQTEEERKKIHVPHEYPCEDTLRIIPCNPSKWPQAPIMLRPTPGSETRIKGIRYADSQKYEYFPGFCAGCILPMNTGQEPPGKSLVVDFESPYFVGTMLIRVRDVKPAISNSNLREISYFDNRKRRFQVTVKGRFKQPLKMSECVTGQDFERRAGRLPASWIINAFIKFISTLAPQLEAKFGDNPRFLTPLVATSQTVIVEDHQPSAGDDTEHKDRLTSASASIEDDHEEPALDDPRNVLSQVPEANLTSKKTLAARCAYRKKIFNSIAAKHNDKPTFDVNKEYTFEFFQHLLLLTTPEEFQIDAIHTKVGLTRILNGQPIKILSAHKDYNTGKLTSLWSFELWHEALVPYAQAALEKNA